MTTDDADRDFAQLVARLRALRRRAVLLDLAEAGALALAAGMAALWVGLALEALAWLPPPHRVAVPATVVLALLATAVWNLVRRLPGSLSLRRLGLRLEARCPQLRQSLISVLELWRSPAGRARYSTELLAATVATAVRMVESIPPTVAVGRVPWARCGRYPAAAAVLLGGSLAWSGSLAQALERSLHPLTAYVREPRTRIALSPGDVTVIRGADVAMVARFAGELPVTARVLRREEGASTWQEEELVTAGADSLSYVFRQVRRPFAYEVRAGDGASVIGRVRLIDPPAIQRATLRYRYPEYTGLPVRIEEDGGDIRALRGTRVELEIEASKPLGQATLVLDDTVRTPASIEGSRARAALEVRRPGRYRVEVVDTGGLAGVDPISHTVEPVEDEPPRVSLVTPGQDLDLPESMKVLLVIEAADDFGISGLWLVHRINDGPEERLRLSGVGGSEVRLEHVWDLSAVELLPEDRVHYRVEALDNDAVDGPKRAVTREYILRFPSLYQLYEETARQREESQERLEELAAEGRAAEKYVEQARRELLRTEEMSWEKRKELEANLAREAERAGAVEELARTLGETLQELERNGLNSTALLEKIAEIRELMAQVVSAEMREALARVQAALEQEDPQALAEALREFSEDQQTFQERLDRTIALLEQIRNEQRLEAAVRQADDLETRQGQINEGAEREEPAERLAQQEDALQQDTGRLQQELTELARSLESMSPGTSGQLADQAAAMETRALAGRMGEMSQQLRAEANTAARRLGAGLEQDLGELAAALRQLQGEFVAEQKEQLGDELRQGVRDLVGLSLEQESLLDETRRLPGIDGARAARQYALMQGVGKVAERTAGAARRTLSLHPAALATIGHALRSMRDAATALADPDAPPPLEQQAVAMAYLNEAALQLRESLDNLARSRMPSSFGEAMQKLLGLSEQQAQLNQATQQSLDLGLQSGRGGRDGRARVDRLAAQQRRILEALQQLQREVRGHRGAEERLGGIEREMEAVAGALEQRRLEPHTTAAQQRLLQRMLDASRSIHTQGEDDEKRKSIAGIDRPYAGPSWLPADLGQSMSRLREALKQAMEGPYPEEYRPPIRQYFEGLYEDTETGKEVVR